MTRKKRVLSFIIAGAIAFAATMCYTLHRSDRRAGIAEVRDRDKVMNFERSMRVDVGNDISLTPHGAFDYSGVAMATNTCQHMIVMCAKSHHQCSHAKYDGQCEMANSAENAKPTFRQMYKIYCSVAKSDDVMKERTLFVLKRIAQLASLPFDGRGELTADEWELVYARLKDGTHPYAHEGGYDPATIDYYFGRYRAAAGCTCKEIRLAYKRKGLVPPDCDLIPTVDFSGKKNVVETLSYAQVKIIKDKMAELPKLMNDPSLTKTKRIGYYNFYMRLFFGLYFGCRPCDIHVLKWDSIKNDPLGAYYFEYVPTKTARKTHERPAGSPIHPAVLSELMPFIGKSGEYVLIHSSSKARGNVKKGRYVRNFKTLERSVGAFMRNEVGVKGFGTTYMLRKECGKYNTEKHGPLYATKLLGNSPNVLFDHYVPIDKLKLG